MCTGTLALFAHGVPVFPCTLAAFSSLPWAPVSPSFPTVHS